MENFNNGNPDQSTTSVGFPEAVKRRRYGSADPRRIWDYLGLLFSMLMDSFNGRYPLPKKTAFIMAFALLYLISPIDIIPEILPVVGFADDIAVVIFASGVIKDDLENYKAWKTGIRY